MNSQSDTQSSHPCPNLGEEMRSMAFLGEEILLSTGYAHSLTLSQHSGISQRIAAKQLKVCFMLSVDVKMYFNTHDES